MNTNQSRISQIARGIYSGRIAAPPKQPADTVNDIVVSFDGKAASLDRTLTKDFPREDNQVFENGFVADSDPAPGSIKKEDFEAQFEGTPKDGKFIAINTLGDIGQKTTTTLFQEDTITCVELNEYFGMDQSDEAPLSYVGQVTFIDRNDVSKSYAEEISPEWLISNTGI